jgi:hypothetical protein
MRGPLDHSLIALERAQVACNLDLRVFSNIAETAADIAPQRPGNTVARFVTGVSPSPDARMP